MLKRPSKKKIGLVSLVGSGPGDPGLLTLKGKECLERAELVFYDHLVNPELFRHGPQAEWIHVGKRGYHEHLSQAEIARRMIGAARRGRRVVRLKGGDPLVFGRGGEEAEALQRAGIPFEIVPGVTSAIAVPAYAGIPLTHRRYGSSVAFVAGHETPEKSRRRDRGPVLDWQALSREPTLVFLMGVRSLAKNCSALIAHGKPAATPAALIEWGTYPRQRTLVGTLQSLPVLARRASIHAPAIAVVGEVVRLRAKLRWYEARPLFGKKVLVTRSRDRASELSWRLRDLGAEPVEFPTLEIHPPKSWRSLDRALAHIFEYAWILFASVHAVDFFLQRLRVRGGDLRALAGARLAAVGASTAERLEAYGLRVDRLPREYTADALATAFRRSEVAGRRILWPRVESRLGHDAAPLLKLGARVDAVAAYRNASPAVTAGRLREVFADSAPGLLTFASSATVENFCAVLQKTPYWRQVRRLPSVVIGPATRDAAKACGLRVAAMPREYTIEAMVEAVLRLLLKRR
jgi:uroporphyrinogen III methyltransferase/synthase